MPTMPTSAKSSTTEALPVTKELTEAKRLLLKKYVRGDLLKTADDSLRIRPRPRGQPAPLSLTQEQIWLRAQKSADLPPFYNDSIIIHRHGTLDPRVLERSFTEIVRRHEAWRTTFSTVDGEPTQMLHPPFAVKLPVTDLRNLAAAEREAEALRLATADACKPFDLTRAPLFRARLIRIGEEDFRLAITAHHMIFDGVTGYRVFLPELVALYDAYLREEP